MEPLSESIRVPLGERAYSILIDTGLLERAGILLAETVHPCRVMLVTNPTVAQWYLQPVRQSLQAAGFHVHTAVVPDGEEYKNLETARTLYGHAASACLDRSDLVVALGGGVIGDLAGFVAATYLRGVGFVQVPTTLLAQIDSSIGGKVGVNLPEGKNLVGAFYQPRLVLSDASVLYTLPEREIRAGLIEMLKHGLLEPEYFAWYEKALPGLLALEESTLIKGIAGSCRIKAEIVAADEREAGRRALLNLGHTVGHGLEKAAGYGRWRHGEAVGFGLIIAGRLALRLHALTREELARLESAVRTTLGVIPSITPEMVEPILEAMMRDKKTIADRLHFVLPMGLGTAAVDTRAEPDMVRSELKALIEEGEPCREY